MSDWEGGLHGEVEAGKIDLGLMVSDHGLGLALDAPQFGQLRAAFEVLADGTTRLAALSRSGVPVLGLTNHRQRVELEARLEGKDLELAAAQATIARLEREIAAHEADAERRLAQAQSALGATQASLEQTDAHRHQAQDQLALTSKTLAETEARLRRAQAELSTSKAAFTETDVKLRSADNRRASLERQLEETERQLKQSQGELAAARRSLGEVEGRLRRLQTQADLNKEEYDARAGAAAAELADISTRIEQADVQRAAFEAQLDEARAAAERADTERESEAQRATVAEIERDEALRRLQLAEDTARSDAERLSGELADARIQAAEAVANEQASAATTTAALAEQLQAEKRRAIDLDGKLKEERKLAQRQKADLDEERARREEMLRDLAYIQSQVKDLASTKGELVARVTSMSDRESRRQRTTAEMSDVLRTAEVVAADTRAAARRHEVRAQKLEDQVRGMTQEILDLRGRAEVSENSVLMLGEQLTRVTKERDALKVDVAFFQKQLGSLQRAAAQDKAKPKPKK